MKFCSKCGTLKLEEEFSKHTTSADGLNPWCKKCYKEYGKQYYEKNKKKINIRSRQWRKNNPERWATKNKNWRKNNPEKVSLIKKKHYKNNKEQIVVKRKLYYESNKEQELLKKKEYRKKHPGCDKKSNMKRKRELGFNPLNKRFKDSVAHHINKNDVVYIPELIHKSVLHNLKTGKNMNKINKIAISYLNV